MRTDINNRKIRYFARPLAAAFLAFVLALGTIGAVGGCFSLEAYASDKEVEDVWLGTPKHVWWETDTVGKWTSVSRARQYQVKLYIADNVDRDDDNWRDFDPDDEELEAVYTIRTSETSCDFSKYMNDLHCYFFAVRATPLVKEQAYVHNGDWVASPDIDFREKQTMGVTEGTWRNYLEGSRYQDVDGNYLGSGWQLIQGVWYLLDANGYRLTGWQTVDDQRYYLGTDGQMATGWYIYNDKWYYSDDSGAMQTGWVMPIPGKYYYLYEDGTMASEAVVDGYWVNASGLREYEVGSTDESTDGGESTTTSRVVLASGERTYGSDDDDD
ncbi:MAG: hypothetical protein LUC99_07905 [Clostridiales bacterium]|nr:hypothetical protein [Clostridiales bacterium]